MNKFISILLLLVISSCNYKFVVNKDRVYNSRSGYLLFLNRQKFFFPSKNIEGNNFFSDRKKRPGYIISFDKEEDVLYHVAEKYVVDYNYNGEDSSVLIRDTIKVLPVIIGSLPYKLKGKRGKGVLTIKYVDKLLNLEYYNTNNEAVWSVSPLLSQDINEASHYYDQ
ncbi:hypothetical protein [Chitinophaga sp. OAE865]|uniref:hypothetical protein n=1 Tax=Chitinophaga sp. OAE865 TaxID=2817898 RepID=UPI001AE6D627